MSWRRREWDALLDAQAHPTPFMRHAYLHALEVSGSVGGDTGWQPVTLTICGCATAARWWAPRPRT